jgi:hypothetical protein
MAVQRLIACAAILLGAALPQVAGAQAVPAMIPYSGTVESGGVLFNGAGQFKFAIVTNPAVNPVNTLWSNDSSSVSGAEPAASVSVPVTDGVFSVNLGDTGMDPMPNIFATSPTYLRVWFNDGVNGSQQLKPDRQLATMPYAFRAATADAVAGDAGVGNAQIADGAITAPKVADGAVGTAALAAGAVTNAKVAAGAVGTANILDGAVTTSKIAAAAVTTASVADAAIGTAEIADTSVTSAKIAAGAVTLAQLSTSSAGGVLSIQHFAAGTSGWLPDGGLRDFTVTAPVDGNSTVLLTLDNSSATVCAVHNLTPAVFSKPPAITGTPATVNIQCSFAPSAGSTLNMVIIDPGPQAAIILPTL